jgi:hypothetical protein
MMGMCRSAVDGGQVALPLTGTRDELEDLRKKLSGSKVLLASPDHAAEYS